MTMIRLVAVLVCVLLLVIADAAHSNRKRIIRRADDGERYDRSITTFSADGRLLQVEYGMEASHRGETMAACIMGDDEVCVVVASPETVHRMDAHVLLVTTGLVGDGRFLASHVRNECQRHRLQFGEEPTVKEVAQMAANYQHGLTSTKGLRPLGCTATVVGIDGGNTPKPRLFQTGPGGLLEEYEYCAAGKGRDSVLSMLQRNLPELSTQEQSGEKFMLGDFAFLLGKTVLTCEKDKGDYGRLVNVWTVSSAAERRGSSRMRCVENVNLACLERLRTIF